MFFAVEPWAPDYGAPAPTPAEQSHARVDVGVEVPAGLWTPLKPSVPRAGVVGFVDGVRRVDAQVWVTGAGGQARPGLCASYAAGMVRCDGLATVEHIEVRREVVSPAGDLEAIRTRHVTYAPCVRPGGSPEVLAQMVQQRMRELEIAITARAQAHAPVDLLVVDGPLRGRQDLANTVGLVKTHEVVYLPAEPAAVADVMGRLAPGERTPLFVMATSWSRFSVYLRLPGPNAHPWAGVVRVEISAVLPTAEARRLADLAAVTLPAFASAAHKDPRAPQNLYPIGGLERALRRRLGDPALLYRSLQAAAPTAAPVPALTPARPALATIGYPN